MHAPRTKILVLASGLAVACQQTTAPEILDDRGYLAAAGSGNSTDPATKNQCNKNGWKDFGFRNQGQCVRFVQTGKDSREEVRFATLSTGGFHTCGATSTGLAYCWGQNLQGELGDGTTNDSNVPVAISGGHRFATVTAGTHHSCGVSSGGDAFCWGWNRLGQLGDGTTTDSSTPVAVSGGHAFVSISAGVQHTCGVTTTGSAYCWGHNGSGQLGDDTVSDSPLPVAVSGAHAFVFVSAGHVGHTCGLTTVGLAVCWGNNFLSQLGDGTTTDAHAPVVVFGNRRYASLSAGGFHTCGATTAGEGLCWGDNPSGQFGDGSTIDKSTPTPVSGNHVFAMVDAGDQHTCGVTTGGTLYCWGWNASGQLGNGTNADSHVPVEVLGGLVFTIVSASDPSHTCGVTTAGTAYCWGNNFSGQLGNGTNTDSNTPAAVVLPS